MSTEAETADLLNDAPVDGDTALSGFTSEVVEAVQRVRIARSSPAIVERARHAMLDWLGVTISGAHEPSARIAQKIVLNEGGRPRATILGTEHRSSPSQAALANAVAGHALDYDDLSLSKTSHPSTPILSAVVALAEDLDCDGSTTIDAMLAGYEALSIVEIASGFGAYQKGFHGTGTYGTMGAAVGCGRLLGLDDTALQHALGLAATTAAGLRVSFGTMGKHLNAANAAVNGLRAAQLAGLGFTGALDALEGANGYEVTHESGSERFDPARANQVLSGGLAIEYLTFKKHACCAGTHSPIDGIRRIRAAHPFSPGEIRGVSLLVHPTLPTVCGIPEPDTGLEGKFSLRYTAALALSGRQTGPAAFTDEAVNDPDLVALRRLVEVVPDPQAAAGGPVTVVVHLRDGGDLRDAVKANLPASDAELPDQWTSLVSKFLSLVSPVLGAEQAQKLVGLVERLESLPSIAELLLATAPGSPITGVGGDRA